MARRIVKTLGTAAAFSLALGLSTTGAHALTNLGVFSGTDCSGGAFPNCYATQTGVFTGTPLPDGGSPVIGKFDYNDDNGVFTYTNGGFGSVTSGDFTIGLLSGVLSFTYSPTGSDPIMRYFTIKQGNSYNLFYDANGITSADITLSDLGYNSISHVGFFDTGSGGGTGGEGGAVPEPATWAMMLLGFGFLGVAMRRRQKQQTKVRYAF